MCEITRKYTLSAGNFAHSRNQEKKVLTICKAQIFNWMSYTTDQFYFCDEMTPSTIKKSMGNYKPKVKLPAFMVPFESTKQRIHYSEILD